MPSRIRAFTAAYTASAFEAFEDFDAFVVSAELSDLATGNPLVFAIE
ncbi:hypothetical protein ABZS99_32420 [Streptomyces sp. NPDC005463]